MSLKTLGKVSYFSLNNEINRPVNGQIPLHKDIEARDAFYKENVEPNTMKFKSFSDKLDYLVENDYIEREILDKYSHEFIIELYTHLKSLKFQFKSFMAMYKFYAQYALKTNDGKYYLENYEERVLFNALGMADGNEQLAKEMAEEILYQRYQPATPTYLNLGRKRRGELVSCYLLSISDDLNSIGRAVNSALQLSKLGGGIALSLTDLREAGSPIKGIENAASGVVPVMKVLEDSFSYANQLGQRQGAGAVYLNVFHPDIIEFLSTKKENADEKIRVKTLSLGLVVPDKFYELTRTNQDMYLFSPYSIMKEYGVPFSQIDITEKYDELVLNPNIRKRKINARALEEEISKLQQESGYPYILNVDTANKQSAVDGKIIMSNLCSEILQPQVFSEINNDQTYKVLGQDISCNLGSANVVNLMKSPDFGKSVEIMTRALTYVSDHSNVDVAPTVQNGNKLNHSIGLGSMNLAGFFAQNQIHYDLPEAVEFTSTYFMLLNYWTLVASNKIAKERNQTFYNFERSKYATGQYFEKYYNNDYAPKLDKIKRLFDGIFIPNAHDWKQLAENIKQYGLYNSHRLATAPTGSISYVGDATASLHPIVQRIEERQEKKVGKVYYPAPGLSTETLPYYKSAYDMDMRAVIDIYAAASEHVDQGLSLTLFIRSEIPEGLYEWKKPGQNKQTTRDLSILRNYAYHKGIKSIYYVRTFTDNGEEVGSNQCESCSI